MSNRLHLETSPYLLQHANNPVDWYPWCAEALERAKTDDKPIFLSVGYSACHWCHVMEHESFENETIAAQLNRNFINIKVDREERPDLDQIYMAAVQIMTGRGGWPMSVFLTPDLDPFFGGTYWPPQPRMGMPGFGQVLDAVLEAWTERRDRAIEQARQMTERISAVAFPDGQGHVSEALFETAFAQLQRTFDATYGGFGTAPKFPHTMDLQLLMRIWQRQGNESCRQMVKLSLDKMAQGGIYDHLGGGFARYSVDEKWLVPHFEKMLYDNALLAQTFLDSYLAFGDVQHRRIVCETLDYVLRDMTDAEGGFHSTEDADSEGEEGKFYVWSLAEIQERLGPGLANQFCDIYDVTESGNFEGHNILNLARSLDQVAELQGGSREELEAQLDGVRQTLFAAREQRVRPGKDDKVIVSWNGLMIDAFARAARVLGEPKYLQAATSAATFLREQLWRNGRLQHSWRRGQAKFSGCLDDYACLANGLVSLYEAGFDRQWIDWAFELMDLVLKRFRDVDGGALFYTADDHEKLIARTKDFQDSSVPSANAMASNVLIRLSHLGSRNDYRDVSAEILESALGLMQRAPGAAGQMLLAADLACGPIHEVAWIGDPHDLRAVEALADLNRRYLPRVVMAHSDGRQPTTGSPLDALFQGRESLGKGPTFYVCQQGTCWSPATNRDEIFVQWDRILSANAKV